MTIGRALLTLLCGVLLSLTIAGCGDDGQSHGRGFVTIQGRVDDGTSTSPIAGAQCRFVDRTGSQLGATTADLNGHFRFDVPPNVQGFMGCNPPGLPDLVLITFVSTIGVAAGETIPRAGPEEVSPRTTVIANVIAQTVPADPQARKAELQTALAAQDPDVTMLVGAATTLFNALRQHQITDVTFSPGGGEGAEEGGGGGGSSGGVAGEAGDGADFSPLSNVPCEFVRHPRGDTALEDLLLDGALDVDRPGVQAIAAQVQQDARITEAFARLFPQGMQPLVNGQPLWTITDANGRYFLPIPPNTPGFVRCTTAPQLAVSAFVPARQVGETLVNRHVTPSRQVFTTFIVPQIPPPAVQTVENNFLIDIGDLQIPSDGIVQVETMATPDGAVVADTNGDGRVCSLLVNNPQEGSIDYVDAGATSYTAIALFKALRIEARNAASASYEAILARVLTRQDAAGRPRVAILAEDLLAGGVPASRATALAARLNECVRFGVEAILGTSLPRMVRTGRFRVEIRHIATGAPAPRVRVGGRGNITAASECRDAQGGNVSPIVKEDNLIVCSTDEQGRITFILEGRVALTATSVEWSVRTTDGTTLLGVVQADFVPAVTTGAVVPVPLP